MKAKSTALVVLLSAASILLSGCYSCGTYHRWKKDGPVAPEVEHKFFWHKDCMPLRAAQEEQREPVPAPAPAPRPAPAPAVAPAPAASDCGPYIVRQVYPSPDCGVIQLDKTMPREVQLNAPFNYSIRVTNLTGVPVTDIVVTEQTDKNYKYASSDPAARADGNRLVWSIDRLEPRAGKEIIVVGSATGTDCMEHCSSVTYVIPACAYVMVTEAKIKVTKEASEEVLVCDPIQVKYVVANTGTGVARDVKVVDTLPDGVQTGDGKGQVLYTVGDLAPAQSKTFSALLKAQKTGKYSSNAVATASGGVKVESSATTTLVTQPVLAITKTGPEKLFLGRPVSYEIKLTNKGDGVAKDVVIEDAIPAGVTAPKPSDAGVISGSKALWRVGTLAPNASKTVSISYMPSQIAALSNTASATAYCADGVRASASTTVSGIAAILLEVIDVDDPIALGDEETYIIVATNQGTMPDTNISIVCTLEENFQYVSSGGATTGTLTGNTITFAPLPSLAPKAKATWQVKLKALKAGDVRIRVEMNTDQLGRPVVETEATHIYE